MREQGRIDNMPDPAYRVAASAKVFGGLRLLIVGISGLLFLLAGSGNRLLAQPTAQPRSQDLIAGVTNGSRGPAVSPGTNIMERVSTTRKSRLPNLVWFSPSSWYPYVEINGQRVPGKPPAGG